MNTKAERPAAQDAGNGKVMRSYSGFTLIELVTVLAIVGIIGSIAFFSMREGFRTRYTVSKDSRNLVIALQYARMRSLENKTVADITSISAVGTAGEYKITFSIYDPNDPQTDLAKKMKKSNANEGFLQGDYVTFSNVRQPGGINGGTYYISSLVGTTGIQFYYYGDNVVDTGVSTSLTPRAKNMTRASELILKRRTSLANFGKVEEAASAEYKDRRYFVYDDRYFLVWDRNATAWKPEHGVSSDNPPQECRIAFDSRGFAANGSGYNLAYGPRNIKKSQEMSWIYVSPFGTIKPGYHK